MIFEQFKKLSDKQTDRQADKTDKDNYLFKLPVLIYRQYIIQFDSIRVNIQLSSINLYSDRH